MDKTEISREDAPQRDREAGKGLLDDNGLMARTSSDSLVSRRELKRQIDDEIAAIVASAERTLQKIRGNANAAEVVALVNAFAVDTVDDVVAFIDKAITYSLHSNSDDYEEYDASAIGVKLSEIAKLRFPDDPTCLNACEDAIDGFLYEIDRWCAVYRGSLIQGLTEDCHSIYEWLTRKEPTTETVTKADLAALVQELKTTRTPPPKAWRKPKPRLAISQQRVADDTGLNIRTVQKWESGELTPPLGYSRTMRQTIVGYKMWLGMYEKTAEYKAKHGTAQPKKLQYKENATESKALVKNEFRFPDERA